MRLRVIWALALTGLLTSCEGSPTLPARIQAVASPAPSVGSHRVCRKAGAGDQTARPAAWKSALDRLARGHSVGIAVGVKGVLLYEHNARRRRTPASNEKLMLSMALFDRFGPGFRLQTSALARRVEDGVVKGPLWLRGGGDPTLTKTQPHFWGGLQSPTLEELAERLKAAGVQRVSGGVLGNTTYFADDFDAPGWQPYVPNRYVDLPAALSLNGNFHVHGHPERAAARSLSRLLTSHGVVVEGAPGGAQRLPPGLSQVAEVSSAPLTGIVAFMDQSSNNFFAEVLGKLLGAATYGPPGTIRKGAQAVAAWTRGQGVTIKAQDSSGLSYRDKVSPLGLVRLLAASEQRPWGPILRHDLAAPGQGTLAGRLLGLEVHAKTGTLFNSDSALSGWVRRAKGSPWVEFAILDESAPKTLEDQIVKVLAGAPIELPRHPFPGSPSC